VKLKRELGDIVLSLLADDHTEDIVVNPDSALWVKRMGEESFKIGHMSPAQVASAMDTIAACRGTVLNHDHPILETELCFPDTAVSSAFPLYDPRLMWKNVIGPGGARELLWLEQQEGYIEKFLQSYPFEQGDVMIVFSHGGSTIAAVFIAMSLVAESGAQLAKTGKLPPTFVSPNVPGIERDHNQRVFEQFTKAFFSRNHR